MYKRFGWDDEVPDQFNGLELNRVFKRGVEVHPMDNLNVSTAMTAAGTYDWKRDGRPPMVPEKLFMAVENFQRQQGLKVDGIMNPGGPTQTRLNEVLPARLERPFIMSKRLPPPDDPSLGKTWEQVWRERRAAGLPAIISTDPHSEGYIGRELTRQAPLKASPPTHDPVLSMVSETSQNPRSRQAGQIGRVASQIVDSISAIGQGGVKSADADQLAQATRRSTGAPTQDPNRPNRTIHGFLDHAYGCVTTTHSMSRAALGTIPGSANSLVVKESPHSTLRKTASAWQP